LAYLTQLKIVFVYLHRRRLNFVIKVGEGLMGALSARL